MKKNQLYQQGEVEHIRTERDILMRSRSKWLVKLFFAFQDVEHVYLAMEYAPGGDFRTLLNRSGVLYEPHVRFYAAQMFLAANELHKLGFIHRDLKPENFLIDESGCLKLTDFGLSHGIQRSRVLENVCLDIDKIKSIPKKSRSLKERVHIFRNFEPKNLIRVRD